MQRCPSNFDELVLAHHLQAAHTLRRRRHVKTAVFQCLKQFLGDASECYEGLDRERVLRAR